MKKTLTLRLDIQESAELEQLLSEHEHIKTASKMLIHCMQRYQQLTESVAFLERKIDHLEHREAVLSSILENARSACAVVCDRTAQQELLSDFQG